MFEQSYLYRYYTDVLTCEVPTGLILEKFDNWLYNVCDYDTAAHPHMLLSHLFELQRQAYAAYVLAEGFRQFQQMLVNARIAAPRIDG